MPKQVISNAKDKMAKAIAGYSRELQVFVQEEQMHHY